MNSALSRRLFALSLAALVVIPGSAASQQADGNQLVVVLNARNPTRRMTAEQLKNLMLGNVAFWHGVVPVKLFVRPSNSPAAQALFDKVLDLPASRFNEHWTAKQLAGQGIMLQSEAWGAQLTGVNVFPLN